MAQKEAKRAADLKSRLLRSYVEERRQQRGRFGTRHERNDARTLLAIKVIQSDKRLRELRGGGVPDNKI